MTVLPMRDIMNRAWLISGDPAWGRRSGIDALLHRLGFSMEDESAAGGGQGAGLVLVDYATQPLAPMPGAASSADVLRFAVVPAGISTSACEALLIWFDGVLHLPLDECTLAIALHARHYSAIPASEWPMMRARLCELSGGDVAIAQRFVRLLIDTNASTIAALCDAVGASLWDAVRSAAHRLNGAMRVLDCWAMVALMSRLELAARQQEQSLVGTMLPVVVDSIECLDRWLLTLLETSPCG